MNKLFGFLGRTGGIKDLPYSVGEPYSSAWGSWTHSKGTSKEDNSAVSIFTFTASGATDGRLQAARNGVKRLRTVRHPNILSFLHSTETEVVENGVTKPVVYVVTEPVMPLADKIRELGLEGSQRDEYFAWGLFEVAKAVSFLNNDCKLVHGNVCVASVVVTSTLDWKLHAFDVLAEFDATSPAAQGPGAPPMLPFEWLVGQQYKPMELVKAEWPLIRGSPPWAIDAWGLGCLIQELFSAAPLRKTEDLRNISPIPKGLLPDYQRLLGAAPNRRLNPSKLIESSEFFRNKLVETIQFMEVLNLKDSLEKDAFFRKLPTLIEQLPRPVVVKKMLPMVASSLEFGAAAALALQPLLKMGTWLPPDEFTAKVLPTITKLFSSTDRAIRIGLLQNIEQFGPNIGADVMDAQVFSHVATGFADSSAFVRELTLKSMLTVAPKLSQRNLNQNLLKYLSKLQVDEEPAIRTNTTILLGNVARLLNEATRRKVLVNAFTRALRDQFPPARAAGLMALTATKEHYDITELGTKVLPSVVVLTIDGDADVRSKAFQCMETFLATVKNHFSQSDSGELGKPPTAPAALEKASGSALLGWAVGSLIGKGKDASAQPPGTLGNLASPTSSSTVTAAPLPRGPSPSRTPVRTSPRQSLSQAPEAPQQLSQTSSVSGWPNGAAADGDGDGDGWDDMEPFEEPAEPSKPQVQRVSTPLTSLGARSDSGRSSNGTRSPVKDGWGDVDDDNVAWADMAVAPRQSTRTPGSRATNASSTIPATKPSLGAPAQHVTLETMLGNDMSRGVGNRAPAQAQHVSLDSVLAKKKTGEGRGRGGPMKLGAQRIQR